MNIYLTQREKKNSLTLSDFLFSDQDLSLILHPQLNFINTSFLSSISSIFIQNGFSWTSLPQQNFRWYWRWLRYGLRRWCRLLLLQRYSHPSFSPFKIKICLQRIIIIIFFRIGLFNSPKRERFFGGIQHLKRRAPVLGGNKSLFA